MLQEILSLCHQAQGVPLSREAIRAYLGVAPEVLDQLLLTLVRKGRLVEIQAGCADCPACAWKKICAGAPHLAPAGYMLSVKQPR